VLTGLTRGSLARGVTVGTGDRARSRDRAGAAAGSTLIVDANPASIIARKVVLIRENELESEKTIERDPDEMSPPPVNRNTVPALPPPPK